MKKIRVKTPAKINLTLKVGKKQPDGFHPIKSVMQAVSLFDYLNIELSDGFGKIKLCGSSDEIPYDERNIVWRAVKSFIEQTDLKIDVNIYIEKNIPVAAGLAGGSTNAAGAIYGLNKLCGMPLSREQIFQICATLGSDLNFCMVGSKQLCTGKGDYMEPMEFEKLPLTIIKPKKLSISTKDAYKKFDELTQVSNMPNDLEFAMLPHYKELQYLNSLGFQMSGSGPSYFILEPKLKQNLTEDYLVFDSLETVNHGVIED